MSKNNSDYYFLRGGGDMGELIRAKDWSKTSLGDPADWPQSLRVMVGVMLDNPFGMYIAWGNDYTQLYNDGYRPILGATKHPQALGSSTRETFSEVWHIIESMFDGVMQGQAVGFTDFMLPLNRNGFLEDCYFDFSYSPIRKDNGEVGGVLVTVIETTSRKKVEEELKESEARFRAIADDAPVFIFLAGENATVDFLNRTWREFTGISTDDMKGRAWAEITHPEDIDSATEIYMDGFNKRESCSFENRQKGTDGIYRTILWKATPRFSLTGQFIGMMGVGFDINERKKAEEKLRESEERFQAAVQAVQGILWTNNEKGEMEGVQPGWASLTGQSYEEYIGYGWTKAVHPDDAEPTVDAWNEAVRDRKAFIFEHRIKTKNGEWRDFSIRAIPLLNADGTLRQWVGVHTDITDNKQAAKTLKENQEKLNIVIHASELGTWEVDVNTNAVTVSQRFHEIMGSQQKNNLTLDDILIRIHPKYLQQKREAFAKAYETGVFYFTGQITRDDNSIRWIESKGKVFYDIQKKPVSIVGTTADITEEKQQQQIILESEKRLRLATETTNSGTFDFNIKTGELFWSDELKVLCGYSKDETITLEKSQSIVHPEDKERVKKSFVTSRQSSSGEWQIEHRIIRPSDKQTRWVYVRYKVSFEEINQQRQAIRVTGILLDVTERKKFELELEESKHQLEQLASSLEDKVVLRTAELQLSEQRFFKIFDSNPIPMTLSEIKTNKIKFANNLFYEAFGYSKEEVIGYSSEELNLVDPEEYKRVIDLIFEYLHESRSIAEVQALSKEETEALLLKLKQSEKMKDFEICYTRKNGETFPALVSYEVIKIGSESYTVTSYQDITERKKSETLLRDQNDQLEKMNKELNSFAYISSHDLQEPLRKIQTFANLIIEKEENNLSDYGKDIFNRMQNAANRMQTLIQDLLVYSRTNTAERKFVTTDLNEIIAEVKEDLKEELEEKNADIEANQLCEAEIIPFQFRQLLHNLVGNSLKFSNPENPPHIQIKSEIDFGVKFNNEKLVPQNKYCHITVSDNGIGFEQKYSERIFELFQRLHGINVYNGTGIGLSIVKKIVENHHGIITAKSELNKGATFDIYIPAT